MRAFSGRGWGVQLRPRRGREAGPSADAVPAPGGEIAIAAAPDVIRLNNNWWERISRARTGGGQSLYSMNRLRLSAKGEQAGFVLQVR